MVVCRTDRKILNKNQLGILETIIKCSQNGHVCSQKQICEHTGLSKSTVLRALKQLYKQGFILKQKHTSKTHVCLATTYMPNTKHLSQYQNLVKSDTEYLSLFQPHNLNAIYNIYNNNIYKYFKNTPNSMLIYKGEEFLGGKKESSSMISYQTQHTTPQSEWDNARTVFYQLLFEFYDRCNHVLVLDLVKEQTPMPELIRGVLTKEEEIQTRTLFREYAKSRNLTLSEFKQRLFALADYLAQRKPYQVKQQNIALSRIVSQKNLFNTLMTEANQSSLIEPKKEKLEIVENTQKNWATTEEALAIIEQCKKQLGFI